MHDMLLIEEQGLLGASYIVAYFRVLCSENGEDALFFFSFVACYLQQIAAGNS